MTDLHTVAETICERYFEPHLTAVSEDQLRMSLIVSFNDCVFNVPGRFEELVKHIRADATPYPVLINFRPPAKMAGER